MKLTTSQAAGLTAAVAGLMTALGGLVKEIGRLTRDDGIEAGLLATIVVLAVLAMCLLAIIAVTLSYQNRPPRTGQGRGRRKPRSGGHRTGRAR